jgi:regulator of sirC expression with transglutaminase-like and TPR domain
VKKSSNEIQALITLLGDEDNHVRDIACEQLLQIGPEAAAHLREATFADGEGRIRIAARHVLEKIRRDDLIGSFYLLGLLEDEQIDLEHAAFLLARVGYSDLEPVPYQRELDRLAGLMDARLAPFKPWHHGRQIIETINRVLFEKEGFTGNVEAYYDPDNSYLNRVLERRTGIPVTLSVLYLLLARRLRLPVRGINLPVHFICQYHTSQESFYFDPFNKGRIITPAECAKMMQGSGQAFTGNCLQPVNARMILARMARNLIWIYYQREDMDKTEVLERIMKMLRVPE